MNASCSFFIGFLSASLLAGCEATGRDMERGMDLVGTSWVAKDIEGESVVDSAQSTLSFVEPGQVGGSGGCNRFFGAVTIDGQSISFGKMGSTMMACPPAIMEQEKRYLDALGKAKRFEVTERALLIFGDAADPLVLFAEIEAAPK